ncbi:MAG: hypothetical protein IKN12_13295 [Selenomonadaceae bacterium]|nr:hypothetical protein [Selenomonadaceae bacterium]MBR3723716.1 hypothetical protein [Selenomonadaceae bacterium]
MQRRGAGLLKTACVKVTASAFVSSMGGNPEPEELLKTADEIVIAIRKGSF